MCPEVGYTFPPQKASVRLNGDRLLLPIDLPTSLQVDFASVAVLTNSSVRSAA